MKSELIRINIIITRDMVRAAKGEANKQYGGNFSYLIRKILGERYDLPYKITNHRDNDEDDYLDD